MKPRLLDLFCGAGGAAVGYHRAGFEVVGVDIAPQPNYPFEFIEADAMDVLRALVEYGEGEGLWLEDFDAIHASPPCQAYSTLRRFSPHMSYPDLLPPLRAELLDWPDYLPRVPYVIENVVNSPLRASVVLCGAMFGLRMYRHRAFETSFPLLAPSHPRHEKRCVRNGYIGGDDGDYMTITGGRHSKAWQRAATEAMGVPWMQTIHEVCEAIPPAYTEFIGEQLIRHITRETPVEAT